MKQKWRLGFTLLIAFYYVIFFTALKLSSEVRYSNVTIVYNRIKSDSRIVEILMLPLIRKAPAPNLLEAARGSDKGTNTPSHPTGEGTSFHRHNNPRSTAEHGGPDKLTGCGRC